MNPLQDVTNRSQETTSSRVRLKSNNPSIGGPSSSINACRIHQWNVMKQTGACIQFPLQQSPNMLNIKFLVPPSKISFSYSFPSQTALAIVLQKSLACFAEAMEEDLVSSGTFDHFLRLYEQNKLELALNYPSCVFPNLKSSGSTLLAAGVKNYSTLYIRECASASISSEIINTHPETTTHPVPSVLCRILEDSDSEESQESPIEPLSGDIASVLGSIELALADSESSEIEICLSSDEDEDDGEAQNLLHRMASISLHERSEVGELSSAHSIMNEEERSTEDSEGSVDSFIVETSVSEDSSADESSATANMILPNAVLKQTAPRLTNSSIVVDLCDDTEPDTQKLPFSPLEQSFREKPKSDVICLDTEEIAPTTYQPITRDLKPIDSESKLRKEPVKSLEHENDTYENIVVLPDGVIPTMKITLLKHQVNGVNWMVSREQNPAPSLFGGGILADDMGLGKTIQTIATILCNPSPYRWRSTLIVCTLSTISQWETELKDKVKSGKLNVCLYYGPSREKDPYLIANADVVLTTYGTLQSEFSRVDEEGAPLIDPEMIPDTQDELYDCAYRSKKKRRGTKKKGPPSCLFRIKWWRIALDEAQYIKNRNTGKHKAAVRIDAYNRWCLTGTPIQNELKDIWSLLHFIRAPECENLRYFNTLLSRLKQSNSKPAVEELHQLVEPLLMRREKDKLKEDIHSNFSDLPPCTIEKVYLDFDPDQALFYQVLWEKAQDNFNKMLAKGTVLKNYMHIFEQILRLRQVCDHLYLLMQNSAELVHLNGSQGSDALMIVNMQLAGYLESLRAGIDMNPTGLLDSSNAIELSQAIVRENPIEGNCIICCSTFETPVQTVCNHFFCRTCLDVWRAVDPSPSVFVNCPSCFYPLQSHQIRSVVVKKKKQRRSTITPEVLQTALIEPIREKNERCWQMMDLPNNIITKIFSYLKYSDMASILNLNLTCKRFYAISRVIFGSLEYSPKVRSVVEHVTRYQEKGKCVIFSQFTKFLEIIQFALSEENVKFVRLDGSMPLGARKKVIEKFQKKEEIRVFIVSLKAAACGLNLTAGRYVYMLDPWWNGAIEQQAIDRVHRYGQKNPVTVFRFIMRGSIEENLLLIQEKKLRISSLVLDESCSSKLSEDDLVTLFTEVRAMQETR